MSVRRLRVPAFALLLLLSIALVGYLVASYAVYDTLAAVPGTCHAVDAQDTPEHFSAKGMDDEVAAQYAMPAPQDVEFRSRDPQIADLTLRAWWIPAERAAEPAAEPSAERAAEPAAEPSAEPAAEPAVLLVHGVKSCRRDENVLLAAGMLHRNGFSVMLMDLRDHGDSDDEDLRFAGGTEEYLDVLGAWDWLVAQGIPEDRIGIAGMSFGAATSVIAGGEELRVQAVWEDSSYADMAEAMRDFLEREGYPAFLQPGAVLVGRIVAGDDLVARGPLTEIPNYAGRRLAIAHGGADTQSLPRYAEALQAAAEESGVDLREYWIVPGMEHTRAVIDEHEAYEPRLVRFFTEALGEP